MEEIFEPIETIAGIIFGRDAIYLDEVSFDYKHNRLTFRGDLTAELCSKLTSPNRRVRYSLTFFGVLAFQMVELDFADFRGKSSFDLVQNSNWIKEFQKLDSAAKVKPDHKHYFLQTYDDIFEIVCLDFELTLPTETEN